MASKPLQEAQPSYVSEQLPSPAPDIARILARPAGARSPAEIQRLKERTRAEQMTAAGGGRAWNPVSGTAAAEFRGTQDAQTAIAYDNASQAVLHPGASSPRAAQPASTQPLGGNPFGNNRLAVNADPRISAQGGGDNTFLSPALAGAQPRTAPSTPTKQTGYAVREMNDGSARAIDSSGRQQDFGSTAEADQYYRPGQPATRGPSGQGTPPAPDKQPMSFASRGAFEPSYPAPGAVLGPTRRLASTAPVPPMPKPHPVEGDITAAGVVLPSPNTPPKVVAPPTTLSAPLPLAAAPAAAPGAQPAAAAAPGSPAAAPAAPAAAPANPAAPSAAAPAPSPVTPAQTPEAARTTAPTTQAAMTNSNLDRELNEQEQVDAVFGKVAGAASSAYQGVKSALGGVAGQAAMGNAAAASADNEKRRRLMQGMTSTNPQSLNYRAPSRRPVQAAAAQYNPFGRVVRGRSGFTPEN